MRVVEYFVQIVCYYPIDSFGVSINLYKTLYSNVLTTLVRYRHTDTSNLSFHTSGCHMLTRIFFFRLQLVKKN